MQGSPPALFIDFEPWRAACPGSQSYAGQGLGLTHSPPRHVANQELLSDGLLLLYVQMNLYQLYAAESYWLGSSWGRKL